MEKRDSQLSGSFILQLRKEQGLTQKELAERLNISDKAVSKWERGINMPDTALLLPLADIFQVTTTELLQGKRMEKDRVSPATCMKKLFVYFNCLANRKTLSGDPLPVDESNRSTRIMLLLLNSISTLTVTAIYILSHFILQNTLRISESDIEKVGPFIEALARSAICINILLILASLLLYYYKSACYILSIPHFAGAIWSTWAFICMLKSLTDCASFYTQVIPPIAIYLAGAAASIGLAFFQLARGNATGKARA